MNNPTSFGTLCPSVDQLRSLLRGDAERGVRISLQAHVAECESCRQAAELLRDSTIDVTESLTESAVVAPESTLAVNSPRGRSAPTVDLPLLERRYRLGQEIARGGMGVVHRASDLLFQREVAIKLLRARWHDERDLILQAHKQAQALEAFQYEAEITARLQHPGIPPVHELGQLADGLPFLAMKLIQGQTLHALLAARSSLLDELPRWISIFEQIAQAVGYAHAQGILHRDLKPLNVMVGQFGEVQVMDWGLAKIVGQQERPGYGEEEDETDSQSELDLAQCPSTLEPHPAPRQFVSRVGDVKGTLQYMPPEQARGEIAALDARADVFGLGAILCQILIGRPPYSQTSKDELKEAAAAGDVQGAVSQIQSCGADPGIVELAISCLSPDRQRRPEHGTAVAQAVAAHRAQVEQRLRQAETERALSEQRLVEQSRRRKLWYAVTAALALLLGGTGVAALIIADSESKARDQAAIRQDVNDFLLDDLLSLADADAQADAGFIVDKDLKVRDLILRAAKKIEGKFPNQPRVEAEIRLTLGNALHAVGEDRAAVEHLARAHELRRKLLGEKHEETLLAANGLASALLASGRVKESVALFETTLSAMRKALGEEHPTTLICMANLTTGYYDSGRSDEAVRMGEETRNIRTRTLGASHPDTLDSTFTLGNAYLFASRYADAASMYEQTLQHRVPALGTDDSRVLDCQMNLANAYYQLGRIQDAIPLFERVRPLREKQLGADHPETLTATVNLANIYLEAGRLNEAEPLLESVLPRCEAKLGPRHPDTLRAKMNLASCYAQTGKIPAAIPLFESALPIQSEVLGADHPHLLQMMINLGSCYVNSGRSSEAVSIYEQLLELAPAKLGVENPLLVPALSNLGLAYARTARPQDALGAFNRAIKLGEAKLGSRHPHILSAQGSLASTLLAQRKLGEALPLAERTYEISSEVLGAEHPETVEVMYTLSTIYLLKGRFHESAQLAEKAWRNREATLGPSHQITLRTLLGCAVAETQAKQFSAAESHLKKGFDLISEATNVSNKSLMPAYVQCFIALYEAWDKQEDAEQWRDKLKVIQEGAQPKPGVREIK